MIQDSTKERLDRLTARFEELQMEMSNPEVIMDQEKYREIVKESSDIQETVSTYSDYMKTLEELEENRELLIETPNSEHEMVTLIRDEIASGEVKLATLEAELLESMRPKDPRDQKDVIMEIRAGAGGDEAALFAANLYGMYSAYASNRGWKVEMATLSENDIGGYKEVIFTISGKGAFSALKYESGVHRVQRVPETESGGRIHTSTVTVAVMAEVDEVEIEIDQNDLRIDVYRASGAGGQHVNKTSSAVRITHLPTNTVVAMQDERSQHKNKDKAMQILRARLFQLEEDKRSAEISGDRASQIGTGDRSERIRTYNYPQGRVTDHRIGLTLYKLEDILAGDLAQVIEPLAAAARTESLLSE